MKDKILHLRVQPLDAPRLDGVTDRRRPLASPEPELEGVVDELRQLHDAYADHHEVSDELAALAARVADAYESVGDGTDVVRAGDAAGGPKRRPLH